jgi:hypothetical protein
MISFRTEEQRIAIVYVCLALLFQPFIKVALGRTIWNIVDVVTATFLLVSVFIGRKGKPLPITGQGNSAE